MAKLYVSEYQVHPFIGGAAVAVGQEPMLASQVVAIGGGSVQSAPFNDLTKFVRLHADSICSIEFGANPTATTNSARMAANSTEFFGVIGGHLVAVISNV